MQLNISLSMEMRLLKKNLKEVCDLKENINRLNRKKETKIGSYVKLLSKLNLSTNNYYALLSTSILIPCFNSSQHIVIALCTFVLRGASRRRAAQRTLCGARADGGGRLDGLQRREDHFVRKST